jgi:hypothetical protein
MMLSATFNNISGTLYNIIHNWTGQLRSTDDILEGIYVPIILHLVIAIYCRFVSKYIFIFTSYEVESTPLTHISMTAFLASYICFDKSGEVKPVLLAQISPISEMIRFMRVLFTCEQNVNHHT